MKRIAGLLCLAVFFVSSGLHARTDIVPCKEDICRCYAATLEGFATLAIQSCSAVIDAPKSYDKARATALTIRAQAKTLIGDYDGTIADATSAIALEAGDTASLGAAYYWRANGYQLNGAYDKALADYNMALSLHGGASGLYESRSSLYVLMGQYDLALADNVAQIKLEPDNGVGYYDRGLLKFTQGNFADATADFERALALKPSEPNFVLWLHLANLHLGIDDRAQFAANSAAVKPDEWPAPLVKLFLEQASIADVDAFIHRDPDRDSRMPLCEGFFAEAEWQMIWRHNPAAAKPLYRHFVNLCPRSFEYIIADKTLKTIP